jgi:cation diffusion facilitator family transporter
MNDAARRVRVRAAMLSLLAGAVIFGAKLSAYLLTGSTAVLSDALESVVNVIAAAFAVWAVRFGAQPADHDHPYGHGKVEFLSAAFEGGLVAFAGAVTVLAAVRALLVGAAVRELDAGLAISAGAAAANLALGFFLVRSGRATRSPTLIADGQHVLSDVWTTAGVLLGLLLVRVTGVQALDGVAALVVALLLARLGIRLVLGAVGGLLDEEDPQLVHALTSAFARADVEGIGGAHRIRAIRAGDVIHVDAHVYVPAGWTVARAHAATERLEKAVRESSGLPCDIAVHLDPRDED